MTSIKTESTPQKDFTTMKMKEALWNKTTKMMIIVYGLLIIFEHWEFIYLRTDETFIGDNIFTKLLCIAAIIIVAAIFKYKPADIGFKNKELAKNIAAGLALGIGTFAVSYAVEILINYMNGNPVSLKFYITNFGLNGATNVMTMTLPALLICISGNIINVLAEEGLFRGIFLKTCTEQYGFKAANWIQAFLFGCWHIVSVTLLIHDGLIGMGTAVIYVIGYVVLAGILALEWGTCVSMSGILWIGLSEHFFNNFIGNTLHVVSETGEADELQLARIVLSNVLSLVVVLLIARHKKRAAESSADTAA